MAKRDLYDLAKAATEEADWNLPRARTLLVKLLSDGSVLSEVTEEAVYFAADQLLREPAHRERSAAWAYLARRQEAEAEAPRIPAKQRKGKAPKQPADPGRSLRAAAKFFSWLDRYRIRNNKPLGDATAEDLALEIEHCRMMEATAARSEAFYAALANKVRDKRVRDVFTNEQVESLARSCQVQP